MSFADALPRETIAEVERLSDEHSTAIDRLDELLARHEAGELVLDELRAAMIGAERLNARVREWVGL